jgi:tetratricopeptide (TPR) repeat protein
MKYRLILLVFLLLVFGSRLSCVAQEDDPKKQAYNYAKQGMEMVDKGHLDEALEVFNKGAALDPDNSSFQYEIAVIYYLKKDYVQTINILEKVLTKPDANDQFYQILGNAYDLNGQTPKARKVYAAGIKRFPKSGALFLESGIMEYMQKNNVDAVRYWESGVLAQPTFATNYYWLAKYYASTTEKVWAVMYGEIFINLERNSDQTQEISDLLYKTYKSCLSIGPDKKVEIHFTKSIVEKPQPNTKLPFEQVFQETMKQSLDSLVRSGIDSLGINEICLARELFLMYWYNDGLAGNYPNILFQWMSEMPEKKYLECYNRWVFLKGNEDAFQVWYYTHTDLYTSFVNWFKKNPLKVSKDKYFSRSLY